MSLLISYSIKNSFARRLTSILTLLGIGLVVFVFAAVLMLANGLRQALVETGTPGNVVALRQAASTEVVSIIYRNQADVVKADRAIMTDSAGAPMFASELVVLINQPRRSNGDETNITVRGVDEMSLKLRPQVRIVQGRMWRPGTSEIIAGRKAAENFVGCGLGETVRFGQRQWTVVGVFEADGSGFESEVWGDVDQLMDAFQRPVFSSLIFRLKNPDDLPVVKARIENDPRVTLQVKPEIQYYREQSEVFANFIQVLGTVISIVFSLGAIVGAMITMYAAVANRTREIGTLRALGFSRTSVLTAFLTEAIIIGLVGGLIGILFANLLAFREVSTTNFSTFAEVAFSFRMSPRIAVEALGFALIMGIVGGFLPAVRAARLRVINSLRAR
jgi:ABC-type lipoprotein release transport system permease subunit